MKRSDLMLRPLLPMLVASWRLVIAGFAAGALVAFTLALVLPKSYRATAVIMPPQQQQSAATAVLGQLGSLAALGGRDLGLKSPSDVYAGLIRSRSIADRVIERYRLRGVYRERSLIATEKALARRTRVQTGKDSLISIAVEDRDPTRAANIANTYVDELQKQNDRLAMTESAQRRLFFERRLHAEKDALAAAEFSLRRTQEQTGVLQVNSQVEAVIRSMSQLRAEIAAREVAIERLKAGATPQNPEMVRQQTEVAALRGQLARLEASAGPSRPGDTLIPTSKVPQAGLEYLRHVRDLKYHETLFELLAKQYEAARIDEARESPIIQIVDRAVPPDEHTWPPRGLLCSFGAAGGAVLAAIWIIWRDRRAAISGLRREPVEFAQDAA
jgi:tyrosine-protein kinase Etk/Wzc